jgi:hypothetical protein
VLERAKTVRALGRAATAISFIQNKAIPVPKTEVSDEQRFHTFYNVKLHFLLSSIIILTQDSSGRTATGCEVDGRGRFPAGKT